MATSPNPAVGGSPNPNTPGPTSPEKLAKRLGRWGIFILFMSSLPLIIKVILFIFKGEFPIFNLISHGELLLITVAIMSSSMADLDALERSDATTKLTFYICFAILVISVAIFASLGIDGTAPNIEGFGIGSISLFLTSIVLSYRSQILAEQ